MTELGELLLRELRFEWPLAIRVAAVDDFMFLLDFGQTFREHTFVVIRVLPAVTLIDKMALRQPENFQFILRN